MLVDKNFRTRRLAFTQFFAISISVVTIAFGGTVAADGSTDVKRQVYLPNVAYEYVEQDWPVAFERVMDRFDNTPVDNPLTNEGATLGRVLFYDKHLSANAKVSCASCHKQSLAFTDDTRLSIGLHGGEVRRNSMSLVNARFYQRNRFFWDERARRLEQQVLMPIEDPIEMGHKLDELVAQLQQDPIYPPLFQDAFKSDTLSADAIAKALAQFVRSIVSYRSRYDIGLAEAGSPRVAFANFTQQENLGKEQFFGRGRCADCHLSNALPFNPNRSGEPYDSSKRVARQAVFFTMGTPAVNGIDTYESDNVDQGVGGFNRADLDMGRFKSPSLRNVAVTSPYMHDGRFNTLDQVIEHYNWSVRPHPNLDNRLVAFAAGGMAMPEVPKVALAAFLETLTDPHLLTDPKYSDPFVPPDASEFSDDDD